MPHDPFYGSRPWRAARAAQLHKQPYCETCLLIGMHTRATEVDHRVAITAGGHPFASGNLRSLCKSHHSQKTSLLDGLHRDSGKPLVITGPDGWPISIEGAKNGDQKAPPTRRR